MTTINWKYKIGDNVKQYDDYGNIIADFTVTDREVRKKKFNVKKDRSGYELANIKYYMYSCNICGASGLWKPENKMATHGCNCCAGNVRIKGINTIGDRFPEYVSYFSNNDAYNPELSVNSKYDVICPICHHTKSMIIHNLVSGKFYCDYCHSFRIKAPKLLKYLSDSVDADLPYASPKYVATKCPNCGYVKSMQLRNLYYQGYSCPICSDRISYGEKFVAGLLQQLDIPYTYQLSKKDYSWCGIYKYDFFIFPSTIIEVHGIQHYIDTFSRAGGRTAAEEHQNDEIKQDLALQNGIVDYIVLDCSKSQSSWIQSSVFQSKLNELYDLSSVDWNKCDAYAQSNILVAICDYFNEHPDFSCRSIADNFHLSESAVRRYLKRGNTLNLCVFDTQQRIAQQKKPVNIYIDGRLVYQSGSVTAASRYMLSTYNIKISPGSISRYCNEKARCIKYPKFRFEFIDE